MKKAIFTFLLLGILLSVQATTYYWIGGTGTSSITSFANGSAWTTDPVGRAAVGGTITIGTTDVFIFDGSNFGATTPATGAVTIASSALSPNTMAQLKLINGANVTLTRPSAGSTAIVIGGDGTAADDLLIDGTSSLTLGGGGYDYSVQLSLGSTATASISGSLYLSQLSTTTHTRSYLTAPVAGCVVFQTGSSCYITDSLATSGFNGSVAGSIVFKSGASLFYYSGRSPIGSSSTIQFTTFQNGSNCFFMGSNVSYVDGVTAYSSSSWTNAKTFSNLFIQNGASITADGPTYKIDNFTINTGSAFTTHTSGQTAVLGNLTVNGTYAFPTGSSNVLVMAGTGTQTISGTGTIKVPTLTVSDVSTVTLNNNIYDSVGCNILGKINFGTNQITGIGTFSARVNYNGTGATYASTTATAGAYQLTGASSPAPSSLNGLSVSDNGAGIIAPNTVVTGFTSAGIIYLSQPTLAAGTITLLSFGSGTCTVSTANTNGLAGSIVSTGTQSFNSGFTLAYGAATTTPFPTGVSPFKPGNITFNANATTNGVMYVSGALTLNNTKLTIRPTDTIRINTGGSIAGTMSSTNYIATDVSGTNTGVLQVDSIATTTTIPVGSVANYMPVTLTPASSASFAVNVFEGITANGAPGGTAFNTTQKAGVVNAVWNINRVTANTDNCTVALKWPASLEGSSFTSYSNSQVGIGRYDNTLSAWVTAIGSGDNTANTATASFSSFGAFGVGKTGTVLPVQFVSISATYADNAVTVGWQTGTAIDISSYTVERSADGASFTGMGSVTPNTTNQYSWLDAQPLSGDNFYRVKATGKSGEVQYSTTVRVNTRLTVQQEMRVYPNPVQGRVLHIQLNNLETSEYSLVLVNTAGQEVFTKTLGLVNGNQSLSVPLAPVAKGSYLVVIRSNKQVLHQQVLIP